MLSGALVAFAILCWPTSVGHLAGGATKASGQAVRRERRRATPARLVIVVVVLCSASLALAAGLVVGLSAALVLGTVAVLLRSELSRAREQRALSEMLAATRTLARELRSGAAPAVAITACASAHRGSAAEVLEALAVEVAGDRGQPIRSTGASGLTSEITGRLARGWALSARYGVPWASLVETVSVDLDDRSRAKAQRSAQVSGPRVSGYVLAAMPCLGILLGVGMGANPLRVLLGTGAGHLMLLVGCLLTCAGLAWTARIIRG